MTLLLLHEHVRQGRLAAQRYDVRRGPSAADKTLVIVTGWTTPLEMADDAILGWTERMCRLGLVHDCEFDGWGTRPAP